MQEEVPVPVSSASSSVAHQPHQPNSSSNNNPKPDSKQRPLNSKKRPQDFELEDNDNWPEVDVGNLIIDLDADIDKEAMSASSGPQSQVSPSSAQSAQAVTSVTSVASSMTPTSSSTNSQVVATSNSTNSNSMPIVATASSASTASTVSSSKLKTLVTSNCSSGSGTVTQTLTETLTSASSSGAMNTASTASGGPSISSPLSDKDKSLKMKIKRTKQGSKHPEGKLEIVHNKEKGASGSASADVQMRSRETSPVPNGAPGGSAAGSPGGFVPGDPALMSAADIVAAAKAAAVKHGGPKVQQGNKVRLANSEVPSKKPQPQSSSNSKHNSSEKQSNGSDHKASVKVNSHKSKVDGNSSSSGGPPAAKRPKVRHFSGFFLL
jgi:hypothetical protein